MDASLVALDKVSASQPAQRHFLDAVGQSGHLLSSYYDDALEDWRAGRLRKMRVTTADIADGALGALTLTPIVR